MYKIILDDKTYLIDDRVGEEIELLRAKNESQADYIRVINRMVSKYKKQLGEA